MKNVDIDEPRSFHDHVYLGCTLRENRTKTLSIKFERCSNHVFLLEQRKVFQDEKNLTRTLWRGPTIWVDMLKNALRDMANC